MLVSMNTDTYKCVVDEICCTAISTNEKYLLKFSSNEVYKMSVKPLKSRFRHVLLGEDLLPLPTSASKSPNKQVY